MSMKPRLAVGLLKPPAPARAGRTARYVLLSIIAALALSTMMPERVASQTADPSTPPVARPSGQPTLYPGGVWEPGPATYGSVVDDDVPVTMDDGIVLRASVAYPTDLASGQRAPGQFPVVIEHTPYVNLGQPIVPTSYFVERGYIYAVVRARGTGTSDGEVGMFSLRDAMDGKALVDWAAHQLEGSDGRIAFVGCSYPGGLALGTATQLGPDSPVKAIVASCVALNQVNRESFMRNGLLTTGYWSYVARGAQLWGSSPASVQFIDWFSNEMQSGGDAAYDREYWRDRQPLRWAEVVHASGIPVLLWAGWQDIVEEGAVRLYSALQNAHVGRPLFGPMAPGQPTTPRYQLIVGNWPHGAGLDAGIYLQWLETWVKGVDTGIQNTTTPMHLFEPGTERWINLAGYPAVPEYASWHLDEQGALSPSATENAGSSTLVWGDPATPESRLSFTSPPLADGATLAGPISATIYASSSNTNLVLLGRLYDVAPDGNATLITHGAVLGSQRELDPEKSWTDRRGTIVWPWPKLERDEYLVPGQVYRFDVALSPRQWGINPGHRLRLELTTQSPSDICPATGIPPSLGTDPCRLTEPQSRTVPGATYTIMQTPEWPSALNLPQLPWQVIPEVRAGILPTAFSESQRQPQMGTVTLPLDWGNNEQP
jgi:uncharacterized protein